jgi:hypothetical protein
MKSLSTLILIMTINFVYSQNITYISTKMAVEDINFMVKSIEQTHYNPYLFVGKKEVTENKIEILNSFNEDSITLKTFISSGMKLVAQMSGGHTSFDWQNNNIMSEFMAYKSIPFTGTLSEDNQSFILTRSANQELLKGAYITSINGVNIIELYTECMSYIGGIETFKNSTIERVFPLYLFFTDKVSAPYSIGIKGKSENFKTQGIGVSELISFIKEKESKENYDFEVLQNNVGLISYNRCTDYNAFEKFLNITFSRIKNEKITELIIDIRENGGGNSSLNELLLSYLTKKHYRQSSGRFWKVSKQSKLVYKNNRYDEIFGETFMAKYYNSENGTIIESLDYDLIQPTKPMNYFSGKTCFLIGPSTFSSANFLADAIKTYKLSTLIGLPTGENTNDFGEQIEFKLPNSGNYIFVSSTYDIGANGNHNLFEPVYPDILTVEDALLYSLDWIK